MSVSTGPAEKAQVAIISANAETLSDLEEYFQGVGVRVACARTLDVVNELLSDVTAVILFPDDFLRQRVIETVAMVLARRPLVLPVLVTAERARYEECESKQSIIVIPRPVWAWMIYDALRSHLIGEPTKPSRQRRATPR